MFFLTQGLVYSLCLTYVILNWKIGIIFFRKNIIYSVIIFMGCIVGLINSNNGIDILKDIYYFTCAYMALLAIAIYFYKNIFFERHALNLFLMISVIYIIKIIFDVIEGAPVDITLQK